MLPEKAKPVLLLLVLACIVHSFFKSDAFQRDDPGFIYMRLYEDLVCESRKEEVREECRVALAEALVPAQLSCLPDFRDLSVCRDPLEGKSKSSCPKEIQKLAECLQTHLGPYGFSDEEIIKLLGSQQKQQKTKKRKPSLDVEKEGGEEVAGQAKNPDKGGEKTGNEVNVESEAPGAGGKPKVEVDQGSEKGKHL